MDGYNVGTYNMDGYNVNRCSIDGKVWMGTEKMWTVCMGSGY